MPSWIGRSASSVCSGVSVHVDIYLIGVQIQTDTSDATRCLSELDRVRATVTEARCVIFLPCYCCGRRLFQHCSRRNRVCVSTVYHSHALVLLLKMLQCSPNFQLKLKLFSLLEIPQRFTPLSLTHQASALDLLCFGCIHVTHIITFCALYLLSPSHSLSLSLPLSNKSDTMCFPFTHTHTHLIYSYFHIPLGCLISMHHHSQISSHLALMGKRVEALKEMSEYQSKLRELALLQTRLVAYVLFF